MAILIIIFSIVGGLIAFMLIMPPIIHLMSRLEKAYDRYQNYWRGND